MKAQTPQAFFLKKLVWVHKEAAKRGITNSDINNRIRRTSIFFSRV
jgi:2-C-methyl-D-erythritol 4-phosphate cytidylyltransferase